MFTRLAVKLQLPTSALEIDQNLQGLQSTKYFPNREFKGCCTMKIQSKGKTL